jgi:NADH:ubiquinone oxidoreductase subunit 2 (subunit N)
MILLLTLLHSNNVYKVYSDVVVCHLTIVKYYVCLSMLSYTYTIVKSVVWDRTTFQDTVVYFSFYDKVITDLVGIVIKLFITLSVLVILSTLTYNDTTYLKNRSSKSESLLLIGYSLFTLLILISTLDLLLIGITVEALSLTLYTLIVM